MSGPKGYSYQVISAEEQARKALAEAVNRCQHLKERVAELNRLLRQAGEAQESIDHRVPQSIEEATQQEKELETSAGLAENRFKRGVHDRVLRDMPIILAPAIDAEFAARFQQPAEDSATKTPTVQSAYTVPETQSKDVDQDRVKAQRELGKAVALIATVENQNERARLVQLAELTSVSISTNKTGQNLLFELIKEVNAVFRAQRHLSVVRQQAEKVVSALDAKDPRVRALNRRISEASELAALDVAVQEARALKQKLDEAETAAFVERTAAAVLIEMGYLVEHLGAEKMQNDATLMARREDLPDHAMQVRLLNNSGLMLTRIVATTDTDVAADKEAEELTCTDSAALAERMTELGIGTRRVHAQPVGSVLVEHTAGQTKIQSSKDTAASRNIRQRTVRPVERGIQ